MIFFSVVSHLSLFKKKKLTSKKGTVLNSGRYDYENGARGYDFVPEFLILMWTVQQAHKPLEVVCKQNLSGPYFVQAKSSIGITYVQFCAPYYQKKKVIKNKLISGQQWQNIRDWFTGKRGAGAFGGTPAAPALPIPTRSTLPRQRLGCSVARVGEPVGTGGEPPALKNESIESKS